MSKLQLSCIIGLMKADVHDEIRRERASDTPTDGRGKVRRGCEWAGQQRLIHSMLIVDPTLHWLHVSSWSWKMNQYFVRTRARLPSGPYSSPAALNLDWWRPQASKCCRCRSLTFWFAFTLNTFPTLCYSLMFMHYRQTFFCVSTHCLRFLLYRPLSNNVYRSVLFVILYS